MDVAVDRDYLGFLALAPCDVVIQDAVATVWRLSKAFCSHEHRPYTCGAEHAVRVRHARGMPSGGCTHVQFIAVWLLPKHLRLHTVQRES